MRSGEIAFLGAVAAFLVGFCALGLFHYDYSLSLMRFPLLAAGFTLLVVAVQLVTLSRSACEVPQGNQRATVLPRGSRFTQVAGLLSVLPLVFLCGFPAGLALYLFGYLKVAGESWTVSLAVAVASLLLSYGLFIQVIGVPLPIWPAWWPA